MLMKGVCLSRRAFFSLNSNYLQEIYDSFIVLMSRGGWSYKDLYALPISKRDWIISRFVEMMKPNDEYEE